MMKHGFLCGLFTLFLSLLLPPSLQAQLQKIYVSPKAVGSIKQSQLIDSITFIPLQQKEDINLGTYTYVELTEKYFLINDYIGKAVLLYKKNGEFLKKIGYKKLGETLYPSYQEQNNQIVFFGTNKNYALTPKDLIKISLDWNNPRNRKYFKKYTIDLKDTSFEIKTAIPEENDILGARFYDNNYHWIGKINTSSFYKDSLDYELKIYRNNKLAKGFFPYNRIHEPRFLYTEENAYLSPTEKPSTYLLSRPYCDTIYRMINDSLFPAYHMVLPLENTLPGSFFTQAFKNKTERENFGRNNAWMLHQVHNFYETPRFIFFSIRYLSNYESYIYQKQNNTTIKAKNIKPDSSQYNLALLGDFSFVRKGNRFYKTVKAGELMQFFEQNKSIPVPKELEAFLKTKPNSASPVIVAFKLKS